MMITTRSVEYADGAATFEAALVGDDGWTGPRATVLLFHGMEGRSEVQVEFCRRIAGAGHRAMAVDVFGTAVGAAGPDALAAETWRLVDDREALRSRLHRVVAVAREQPGVDPDRVVAAGFCFGGLCVLDLARNNEPVRGVASFHGVLTTPSANTAPITPRIAVYHGWDDPFAPPEDVLALGRELTERRAEWQLHAYGSTLHSFMAEGADDPERGIRYNATSARRAWRSFLEFVPEALA